MIVVTGSAGLVGSSLLKELRRRGQTEIQPVDRTFHQDLRFYSNTIGWKEASEVYHLAADLGGIGYLSKNHADIALNNTRIDLNVLEAVKQKGVKNFLYTSSACAYPVQLQGPNAGLLRETDAIYTDAEPGYGTEKRYMEEVVGYFQKDFGVNTHITRFMNVYGPETTYNPEKAKVINSLCAKIVRAQNGDTVEVWGDGTQVRDFVHVEDVAKVLVDLMATDYHAPVNVGTGVGTSVFELVARLIAISGKDLKVKFLKDKPTGVACRVASTANLKQVIGWVPAIKLEDALPEVYEWVKTKLLAA